MSQLIRLCYDLSLFNHKSMTIDFCDSLQEETVDLLKTNRIKRQNPENNKEMCLLGGKLALLGKKLGLKV